MGEGVPLAKGAASDVRPTGVAASSSPTARKVPATNDRQAFWSSEVLTSRKPPAYLRLGSRNNRESAIDLGIKEALLNYPVSQLRKPSEVMEVELKQLRQEIS